MRPLLLIPAVLAIAALATAQGPTPLVVCATTPNLAALVRALTEPDEVELHVFARPGQDPHFVRALPSFVKQLHEADLLLVVGLDLEEGWVPALLDAARNPDVRPGGRGHLDASTVVRPLGVPAGNVDRTAGDVHFRGNPHFLVDPVAGAAVADAIAARLGELRPERRAAFAARAAALRAELGALVVGPELAATYDFAKLVRLAEAGRLDGFLDSQGDLAKLGGALRDFAPFRGTAVLADHDAWRYLLATLGLQTLGFLEPRPGIPPSTAHLRELVERARATPPRALLHAPYFERRAIDFVTEATGVPAVELAHQAGALPGTDGYAAMVAANLARLRAALGRENGSGG